MLEDENANHYWSALYDFIFNQVGRSFASDPPPHLIVLTEILAAPLNYGYSVKSWRALASLNGEAVPSLRALHAAYSAHDGEFLEFAFTQSFSTCAGEKIVLDTAECRTAEAAILRTHGIASLVSQGIAGMP